MCLITEHTHALKELKEVKAELASVKSQLVLLGNNPVIPHSGTININEMSSILLDKLDDMDDDRADIYLADVDCKVYKKQLVMALLGLYEVNKLEYVAETMDCDDFAATLYGKGLPLIWTNLHALNWFIDDNEALWFVEPQTNKISQALENWQGWDVRFFINR